MSRYIDADEAKENACKWECGGDPDCPWNTPNGNTHEKCEFMRAIDECNTADVAPVVHGHWIRGKAYPHHIFCSNCYRTYVPNDETEMWKDQTRLPRNYCPDCGAKMDEVSE